MLNENLPKWMKLKDDALYYVGDGEFVFYVPESFFEHNHAIQEGDVVYLIGILNWAIIKKGDDPTKYSTKSKPFDWPTAITTRPGRIEKVKGLKIVESQKAQDFRIFIYENNGEDQILESIRSVEDIENVERAMSIFETTGKIPPGISYYDLYTYYLDPMTLNGGKYGLSIQEFGLLSSEICRDPNDYSKPFRLSKKLDTDPYCYNAVSVKQVSKLVSPFTAITTENWDKAVISSAIISDEDIKDTPMEKIMMG